MLRGAGAAAERLPTPEERFAATRPAYEQLVADGFLRDCLPESVGGDNQSLIDTAIVVEEFYCGNPSIALTLVGTVLGLQPIVVGGTSEQQSRLLAPFLVTSGAPLAAFCSSEPGGSANAASPPPGEGVRTRAVRNGDGWVINGRKKWVSSATGGPVTVPTSSASCAAPTRTLLRTVVSRSSPWRRPSTASSDPENFLLVDGDIGKAETATKLFEKAVEAFSKVDVLVNNAGVFIAKPVGDFTEDDVDSIVATNLKGFFYPAQAAAKHMSANGSGHIITITACNALQPNVNLPCLLTAMTKGGLDHAVKALALELASSGVQVNGVAPGIIDTPILPRGEENWAFFRTLAPNGKTGVPQDIVDAVLYLTGSTYVTGAIVPVDGGSTAGVW